jgi:hypothetical protein
MPFPEYNLLVGFGKIRGQRHGGRRVGDNIWRGWEVIRVSRGCNRISLRVLVAHDHV